MYKQKEQIAPKSSRSIHRPYSLCHASRRILAFTLLFSLPMIGFPYPELPFTVHAASDKTITGLGTGAIGNPIYQTGGWQDLPEYNGDTYWVYDDGTVATRDNMGGGWSYVYFGNYSGSESTIYRVLDNASSDFGIAGGSMLLDCDVVLYTTRFDDDGAVNNGATYLNSWRYSDLRNGLNGSAFLDKPGNFTSVEKASIASSYKSGVAAGDGVSLTQDGIYEFTPLEGDQVFVLDAYELSRPSYGYKDTWLTDLNREKDSTRVKSGFGPKYWLRTKVTPQADPEQKQIYQCNSFMIAGGCKVDSSTSGSGKVAPAFNVSLSSIISSSLVAGNAGEPYAEYKLTLLDPNMVISVAESAEVSRNANTVTIPYVITGENRDSANQVSVILLDEEYVPGKAVSSGFAYIPLEVGDIALGTGSFTLPAAYASKTCGTDYYAYVAAESVNGGTLTDYSSALLPISIPNGEPGLDDETQTDPDGAKPTPNVDDVILKPLYDALSGAVSAGSAQTITFKCNDYALPIGVMRTLAAHPEITLVYDCTYEGTEYVFTIRGRDVIVDESIPWYGPLYLAERFLN